MITRSESPDFYILLALLDRPRHGLSVQREVLELSEGRLRLWPATLYTSLARMASRGWIEELGPDNHPNGESQKRRYFRLTSDGRRILNARVERLGRLVAKAGSRLADHPLEDA